MVNSTAWPQSRSQRFAYSAKQAIYRRIHTVIAAAVPIWRHRAMMIIRETAPAERSVPSRQHSSLESTLAGLQVMPKCGRHSEHSVDWITGCPSPSVPEVGA